MRRTTITTGPAWMGPLPAAAGCDCQICRPEESYDEVDRRTIDAVLQHGWQVMVVSDQVQCSDPEHGDACHHDDDEPGFAYTIGLGHRCGHPELFMSGLDVRLMHSVLNGVAQRVMAGRRLTPGDVLEGALGGVPLVVERVSEAGLGETALWSEWFHRRDPEALQLVWPTTAGVFSWQPGAPEALDDLQPPRWREPCSHSGGVAGDPDWVLPVPADALALSCEHVIAEGAPVLFVTRQPDPDGAELWTVHCGQEHADDELGLTHVGHLVRAVPSLRDVADLPLGSCADRESVDQPWQRF